MNVAHVVRQFCPSVGGLEEMVRNLAIHQARGGEIKPRVVTLNRLFGFPAEILPSRSEVDGIPVERLSYRGSPRYPICPQVLKSIESADLVHVHGIDFFFDYLAVTRAMHGKPLVASTHGGFFHTTFAQRLKRTYFSTVTRAAARSYRCLVATSVSDGANFAAIVPASRLRVIENGVDVDKFADAGSPILTRSMLYFGRWSSNKGLMELLERFAAVQRHSVAPWTLTIAGMPSDLSEAELVARVRELNVASQVRLVTAPDTARLRSLIACNSYYVCFSRHEGFGLSAVEAISAGLIPILSDIPPFRRLIERAGSGLLLGAGVTPDDAAAAILGLHESLDYVRIRRSLQEHSREYAWSAVSSSYANVYADVGGELEP
jgi:alpha-1,3-mannosyltransferase